MINEKENNEKDGKLFVIKTLKAVMLKTIFEVIKPYIKETNIMITPTFIKIAAVDTSENSITYVKLDADKFESYYCKDTIIIGVDTTVFFKTIKSTTRRDTITLEMEENNTNLLKLTLHDVYQGKTKQWNLPLLALEKKMAHIDDMQFSYVVQMSSSQFQQIIKDIHLIDGKIVEIKTIEKQLIFSCTDGMADFKTIISEVNDDNKNLLKQNGEDLKSVKFTKHSNTIVQGKFKMSYLMNFIKASHLCDDMQILLTNDQPLVLQYNIPNLGIFRLLLVDCNI